MSLDDKDLEIARLRGKVEALEGELAKERALRPMQPAVWPNQLLCSHVFRDMSGRCMACGHLDPLKVAPLPMPVYPVPVQPWQPFIGDPGYGWPNTTITCAAVNPFASLMCSQWDGGDTLDFSKPATVAKHEWPS